MSLVNWEFACDDCDFRAPASTALWHCPDCDSALHITGLRQLDLSSGTGLTGMWRYASTLPTAAPGAGTILGEGGTPLVPVEIDGVTIHLKLDSHLPSGSFKDRGAAVLASYLKEIDAKRLIVDSSGNAAAAMSAYASALGLDCSVYVPANASPGKLVQARAYGAVVIPVEGSRDDVARAAQVAAEGDETAFYASHNWHPVFVEGVKTWAIEVWEQLARRSPDVVFIPTGGGSAYVGAWRGFQSIDNADMPKLVSCQPSACAPVVHAWEHGSDIERVQQGETIAEGTKIALPSRPSQIMKALRESDGYAIAVDEDLLTDTLKLLWQQGFYVEPTAGLGVAACRAAIKSGEVETNQTIVAHVTGHGLKATGLIGALLG